MAFVGETMKDMLVQSTCYYVLLGIFDREGEEALNEYVKTVEIR